MRTYILFTSLIFYLSSCMNTAIVQTAKPLKKGESELGFGLAAYTSEAMTNGLPEAWGMSWFAGRFGWNQRMDLGLRLAPAIYTHAQIDVKLNLYHNPQKTLYFSSGLQVNGGFRYIVDDYDRTLSIPLYLSFHRQKVSWYLSQRVGTWIQNPGNFRYYNAPLNTDWSHKEFHFDFAGGIGLKFEGEKPCYLELTYLYNMDRSVQNYDPIDNRIFKSSVAGFQLSFHQVFRYRNKENNEKL